MRPLTQYPWWGFRFVQINIVFRERDICTGKMEHFHYLVLPKRMLFKENAKPITKYNRLYSRDPHLHVASTSPYWISIPSFPPLHFARTFVYWGENELWVSRYGDVYNSGNGSWEYQVSGLLFVVILTAFWRKDFKPGYCKGRVRSWSLRKLYLCTSIAEFVHS